MMKILSKNTQLEVKNWENIKILWEIKQKYRV